MDGSTSDAEFESVDVYRLLTYIDQLGLQPHPAVRGWAHMGAVICDAGLQAGINYTTVVLPRLRRLIELWPTASTTSAFVSYLATKDLSAVLQWRGQKKLAVISALADALQAANLETTTDLGAAYVDDQAAAALASSLRMVNGVGRKTIDYLAILVGSDQHVAVDQHLRAFARQAGITNLSYEELRGLYVAAARRRGWTPGALDRSGLAAPDDELTPQTMGRQVTPERPV